MAPAGRAKYIPKLSSKGLGRVKQVFKDLDPFMKHDVECIFFLQGFCQTIFLRLIDTFRKFRLKGAEHFIPNNEKHPKVFIQVQGVGCMMYPMV
jgi:hypothetical protein